MSEIIMLAVNMRHVPFWTP